MELFEEFVSTHHKKHYNVEGEVDRGLFVGVAGLAGEAGEVCDAIKKIVRGDTQKSYEESMKDLLLEMGDCLHYLTFLGQYYGFTLEDIATANVAKLIRRHEDA